MIVAKTIDETSIVRDPATSFWLREQIKVTKQHDILDVLRQRWSAIVG